MGQAAKTIRKTLKWCAVLLLVLAAAAGAYGYTLWQRSNELLRQAFVSRLREIVPDWDITVGSASLDRSRNIHIYDLQVFAGGQKPPIVNLPEIVVTVDVDAFIDRQAVVIEKVTLIGPRVHLCRRADGAWNWQLLTPPKKTDRSLPEFEIQQGTLSVYLENPGGGAYSRIVADGADVRLVPSAKRQFVFSGRTQVEQAGTLSIDGNWNVDAKAFACSGRMRDVALGQDLLEAAAGSSQKFQALLSALERKFAVETAEERATQTAFEDGGNGSVYETAATGGEAAAGEPPAWEQAKAGKETQNAAAPKAAAPHLGLAGTVDVEFLFSRMRTDAPPDFQVKLNLRQGQIANPLLPFPLYELAGKLEWDNRRVALEEFTARNGNTRVNLAAELSTASDAGGGRVQVRLRDLVFDERLRRRLPERYRKIYDQLSPTGQADVAVDFERAADGTWSQRGFVLTAKRCTCVPARFPYRIVEINGTATRNGSDLDLNFEGVAGGEPIVAKGVVRNLGPEAETQLDLRVSRLPLDENFRAACPPGGLRAIETLGLRGWADIDVQLHKPAGSGQRMQWSFVAQVADGQLEIEQFPYRMKQVTGTVRYASTEDVWRFENVRARHGDAVIGATGVFARAGERAGLRLSVAIRNAGLDGLQTPLSMYVPQVFQELSPTGVLHADATIRYVPGHRPDVRISRAELFQGTIVPRAFPYPLGDVRAAFNYVTPGHVEISSFSARHEQTPLSGTAVFNFSPTGWELKVENFAAESVVADHQLRAALPADLQTVADKLNPQGPFSVAGTLYFRGTDNPDDRVAATWDLETKLAGNAISLGVQVNNASGVVTTSGTVDARGVVRMQGTLNLDSLSVRQYQLTQVRGPFQLEGNVLTLGSPEALLPLDNQEKQPPIALDKRITARVVEGMLTLDTQVRLDAQPQYHALLTISKEDLEKFARRYMSSSGNIRGTVNGWIDLHGAGTSAQDISGRGQVQISPAALYKLPVIAQILDLVRFAPPDDTAFRYAFAEFEVGQGLFKFKRIDLIGEALSLSGFGTAQFDPPTGRLDLEFAARLPRNPVAQIPLVNILADEAARALVGVTVTGTTQAPIARQSPTPPIMRQFQSLFEARPNFPLLDIPTLGPVQPPPQTYRQPRGGYRR